MSIVNEVFPLLPGAVKYLAHRLIVPVAHRPSTCDHRDAVHDIRVCHKPFGNLSHDGGESRAVIAACVGEHDWGLGLEGPPT